MGRPKAETCEHPATTLYHHLHIRGNIGKERAWKPFVDHANDWYAGPECRDLLDALSRRRAEEVAAMSGRWSQAVLIRVRTTSQLVVGSSFGRLWEVGFQLHPLYGVPYIPATGIRGAVRHWALEVGYEGAAEWFGEEEQSPFWVSDAFPKTGGELLREGILNKHHKGYYEEDPIQPPADYDEPVPVYFLAVPAGVDFEFIIAMSPVPSESAGGPLGDAKTLVADTLALAGLGAKTRKGYGQFGGL